MIVRMNVLLQPIFTRLVRVGYELTPRQLTHLAPVRAHAVDRVGARGYEGSIESLTFAQLPCHSSAFDTFPTTHAHQAYELYLVVSPNTRLRHVYCHRGDELAAFLHGYADACLNLRRHIRRQIVNRRHVFLDVVHN